MKHFNVSNILLLCLMLDKQQNVNIIYSFDNYLFYFVRVCISDGMQIYFNLCLMLIPFLLSKSKISAIDICRIGCVL